MISNVEKAQAEREEFVKATGKCITCKKNPVAPGSLRCGECEKKTEDLLKSLGFVTAGRG
jgi:hypothetical protein